ncbi:hypothetical protein AB1P65_09545 [Roseibium alexandrii]
MASDITPDMARKELARRELERRRGGAQPQQAQAAPTPQGSDPYERSTILPFSRNKETGEIDMTVPGLLQDVYKAGKQAFTAPGRALAGELDLSGPGGMRRGVEEGLNMALFTSPASPAQTVMSRSAPAAVKPKPEKLAVAESAARQGVELPAGVASDAMVPQQLSKTVASVPWAGTPLRQSSERALGQLDDAARQVQQGYGSGSRSVAGSMVRSDMTNYAKSILPEKVSAKYALVDDLVQPNVVSKLESTKRVADSITAKRLNADLPGSSKAVEMIRKAADNPQGLNYEGIKTLRTSVGEVLNNPQQLAASKMSEGELKQIYGALTQDLERSVGKSGGKKAMDAWRSANTFAAKTAKDRKALDKIIGKDKSDEAIFESLQRMAGSTAQGDVKRLAMARKSVSPETWDELASSVVSRIGRDAEGNFSPDRFLTAYGKLSPQGKAVLFNSSRNKELGRSLEDIAKISSRFKQLNQYANPSGTGQTVATFALGAAALPEPMTVLSSMASGRVIANMLSKPVTADKVAKWAQAYERSLTKPTPATQRILQEHTQSLAVTVSAIERGLSAPVLNRASQAIAGPEDQNGGRNENEENRQPSQLQHIMNL